MILYTPENGSHPDKNDISLGWQRGNISGARLELSIRHQRMVGLGPQYRSVYHLGIR